MTEMDVKDTAAVTATEIASLRAQLRQKQFAEVMANGNALLAREPQQRDALLFVAIAQRNLGQVSEALQTLAVLERHHPRFSRLSEERGHCFVALRQAPQALQAFEQAVTVNYALPASWSMLEGLNRMAGNLASASAAATQVATLRKLPPPVVAATALFLDGDLDLAEPMVRAFLLQHGDEVEAMRLLARIGIARKVFDDAELLLSAVLELAPDYRAARAEYAEVLIEMQKHTQATRELDRLVREDPANRLSYQGLQATAAVGLGEHEKAVTLYRELLRGTRADADVHLSIAHALKTIGRQEEAVESYRNAAAARPDFGDAYWSIANLKTYRFTPEELSRLKASVACPGCRSR